MTAVSSPLLDDGAARHLKRGRRLPNIALPTTAGRRISFAKVPGRAIVYCYPWTGRPGLPNPPGWDGIPGAHGSTPQTEGFRNLHIAFRQVDANVFGLSTQTTDYQQELVNRLELPFELVSDADFEFAKALSLPTFQTGGVTYLKRLTLCLNEGVIERVYYPIDLPAAHAREVCAYLGMTHRTQ
jgi:peroxiredoxin